MHDEELVPESNIKKMGPISGRPSNVRPADKKHLVMMVPRNPALPRPSVTVTMPDDPAAYHLTRVQAIKLLGNFMLAEIQLIGESRETGEVETFTTTVLNDKKPIVLDGLVVMGSKLAPIYIESIRVTIVSGLESNKVLFDMEVYACFDKIGELKCLLVWFV
jgi:hypothetical protein